MVPVWSTSAYDRKRSGRVLRAGAVQSEVSFLESHNDRLVSTYFSRRGIHVCGVSSFAPLGRIRLRSHLDFGRNHVSPAVTRGSVVVQPAHRATRRWAAHRGSA